MEPVINIVTISYNQGEYLEECINSVISQGYSNYRYYIIDGGSNDNSIDVIKKYESQLFYWVSEKDKGPAHALNKALKIINSGYFFYLNSDDVLLPNALSNFILELKKYPNFDVYHGNGYLTNKKLEISRKFLSDKWNVNLYRSGYMSIMQQATFVKVDSFKNFVFFNELNRTCWDGEFLVDLSLAKCTFKRINGFYSMFRIHESSITGMANNNQQYKSDLERIKLKIPKNNSIFYGSKISCYVYKIVFDFRPTIYRFFLLLNRVF